MKIDDLLYRLAWLAFYLLAVIVTWNWAANESWRFLSEMNRKIVAIIGLCIYVLLVIERKRRTGKTGW